MDQSDPTNTRATPQAALADVPLCMRRRDVLVAGAVGSAAAVLYPNVGSAAKPGDKLDHYPRLKIASVSALQEGEPVAFNYPLKSQPNMIVKLGTPAQNGAGPDQDIVAYSVLCTHMGGTLRGRYKHDFKSIGPCPFHLSTFDLTKGGTPVHASATQNLPQILLDVDGDDIYAVSVNGLIYGYRDNLADGAMAYGTDAPRKVKRG